MEEHLTDKHQRIIQRVARGEAWRAAAREEGLSESYARVIGHRLKKNPVVVQMLKEIQAAGSAAAGVTLAGCIAQAQADHEAALQDKAHMAAVQATKLVCQLCGHLVDRVEVVNVDLRGSLERSERRVLRVINGPSALTQSPPAALPDGTTRWKPRIAGDPEDPEAGPADGRGGNAA